MIIFFRNLQITGEGAGAILRFDPGSLDLGTVLPMSPGVEKIVSLASQCDYPVEIYSVDFDQSYMIEEDILNTVNIYDINGIHRTGVRNAGDNLPSSILTNYKRMVLDREREKKRLEIVEKENIEGSGSESSLPGEIKCIERADSLFSMDILPDSEKDIFLITPPIRIQQAPRDNFLHQDIIVFGLPLTGSTSISRKLSKKLHLIMRNIDEIIQEIVVTDSDVGIMLRKCLNLSLEREKVDFQIEFEKLFFLSEESKKIQSENIKKDKKKSRDLHVEIPLTTETKQYEMFAKNIVLNSDNLAKIIAYRLTWNDVGQGMIIDGFYSSHLNEQDCVKALKGKLKIY